MNLLIDVLQIIVMVIGMKFPKHPKKYFLILSFYTFEIFAKTVKKMRSSEIVKKFNNKIIVIDEGTQFTPIRCKS